jgi:hypothetical protein
VKQRDPHAERVSGRVARCRAPIGPVDCRLHSMVGMGRTQTPTLPLDAGRVDAPRGSIASIEKEAL